MSSLRIEKVNELLKKELGNILPVILPLRPGTLLTLKKVCTTPDLKKAVVFLSVFPERESKFYFSLVTKELFRIQGLLNKRLRMRPLPRIEFENDPSESRAQVIEETIRAIREERDSERFL